MAMVPYDEEEAVKDSICPEGDVFSYSMLAAPQERKRNRQFTKDACLSYVLVVLVLVMQGVLLYCVYNKVVVNNMEWKDGIMKVKEDWNLFQPVTEGCNAGQSLCTIDNGTFSCAPPSVQLVGRWDELDVDGDGIWTREEVVQERERLKCKYVVDPLEIFDVFVFLLKEREKHIFLHPDVKAGKLIHKPYFTYAMGDIAMCGYRNQDMCPNLLKRGVFQAALRYGKAPRVGNTVESALDYCRSMLEPMGYCERALPSTYATWKIESVVQCQKPKYKKFVYEHPTNGIKKSLLEVDYKARQRYETAQTLQFMTYKGMICGVWMLLIISQLRHVWKVFSWVLCFPAYTEPTEEEIASKRKSRRGDDEDVTVEGITMMHRVFMGVVTILRMMMLCILMYVGMSFLGRQTDYIGLLLDGVALIFIIEVQEIIYERVIRDDVRQRWEDSDPVETNKLGIGYLNKNPDIADMAWLALVILCAAVFMWYYTKVTVRPLHDSLQCACIGEGDKCYEAHRFSQKFWDHYWRYDVPGVLNEFNDLKNGRWQYQQPGSSFWLDGRMQRGRLPHSVHLGVED